MEPGHSPSACDTALGIEELLAKILNFLPLLDLPRAETVCRRWNATIRSSALRKSLFLEAEPTTSYRYVYDADQQLIAKHPCRDQQPSGRNPLKQICVVNELMFEPPRSHQVWKEPQEMPDYAVEASILNFRSKLDIRSFSSPPLLDMLITQPPITKAQILWVYKAGSRVDDVFNPNGIRGRDIFNSVPKSRYPMSMWSAVDQIKLDECHLRIGLNWYKPVEWTAVSLEEREKLDALAEGHRIELEREKEYFTP